MPDFYYAGLAKLIILCNNGCLGVCKFLIIAIRLLCEFSFSEISLGNIDVIVKLNSFILSHLLRVLGNEKPEPLFRERLRFDESID
ncbi:hypothetical protein DSECCO2_202360 [anaerobic digester metagenome]|jgi:hypothetical protein